jgi:hypothetical protein
MLIRKSITRDISLEAEEELALLGSQLLELTKKEFLLLGIRMVL